MHASCESPWHSLAKRTRLGGLLPPQAAFQEHAAPPPRWPGELSPKGLLDSCIPDGVSTFLYRAFTAHGPHLVLIHAPLAFASFETRFNTGASLDHARQFRQRRLFPLHLGHTRRREIIVVAVAGVLIGGIWRGLGLQRPLVRQGPTGDQQPLLGSRAFALDPRLHAALDHLDGHRPFLPVSYRQVRPRLRIETLSPLRYRLPGRFGAPSTSVVHGQRRFEVANGRGA